MPAAGNEVISTVTLRHPQSLDDFVPCGIRARQSEAVRDEAGRSASRTEPVDLGPRPAPPVRPGPG
ncbi:hypothetical protein CH313_22080 [Streptomyces sp. TSRI0384-2]|uniref:Uncharacterized protein n=1 Tax=Streptomyces diastaticus subsp. diastaticus TaxID=68040 RepID=A0ABQ1CQG1_STRDI|nr:hypothetical protein [Streptomyces sp. SID8455]PJM81553.1 hypothetical protein CH313_22080 [Streptomyces sp. TSRI0384-2]GFH72610.1 hypothetical protein Sdia_33780 [Streptomyces diastaticus subsp. diastaticus]GGU23533.1 hypothetical protein GCM10015534_27950 [Streptomyces diastaticus subsp. diastaticus]